MESWLWGRRHSPAGNTTKPCLVPSCGRGGRSGFHDQTSHEMAGHRRPGRHRARGGGTALAVGDGRRRHRPRHRTVGCRPRQGPQAHHFRQVDPDGPRGDPTDSRDRAAPSRRRADRQAPHPGPRQHQRPRLHRSQRPEGVPVQRREQAAGHDRLRHHHHPLRTGAEHHPGRQAGRTAAPPRGVRAREGRQPAADRTARPDPRPGRRRPHHPHLEERERRQARRRLRRLRRREAAHQPARHREVVRGHRPGPRQDRVLRARPRHRGQSVPQRRDPPPGQALGRHPAPSPRRPPPSPRATTARSG